MKVVADTGPILAAASRRDIAHPFAAALVTELGRDLLIPEPVLTECDYMLRSRVGLRPARRFLSAVATGAHTAVFFTSGLFRRAVEIDEEFAELDLGIVDSAVIAVAERDRLPILTFDFEDFSAARTKRARWRLLVDKADYVTATRRR